MLLNNRYQILHSFKSGGFGETFVAEDTQMPSRRRCLIKRLYPINNDPKTYKIISERFHREAAILEDLGSGSDQIPSLYGYLEENGNFYLVQELIEGKTLSLLLEEKGIFSEAYVKQFLTNLLPVLDYVHSKHIVHRDIKPDNIIIRKYDNKPVLIDFGAVKESIGTIINTSGNVTGSIVIGTPGFMPSEQAAGRPLYSSDLYALSLTAIYMLTGKLPQTIETDPRTGEILWKQYAPKISPTLAYILDKSIHSYARERYFTAKEMLQALEQKTLQKSLNLPPNVVGNYQNNASNSIASSSNLSDLQKTLIISSFLAASVIVGFWITKSNSPAISSSSSQPSSSISPSATPSFTAPDETNTGEAQISSISPLPTPSFTEKDLLGIWYSTNNCSNASSAMIYRGTTEFFRNGSYTYIGEINITETNEGRNYNITYDLTIAGEWKLDNDILVTKLVDMKSSPTGLSVDDNPINLKKLDQSKLRDLRGLEEFVPKGSSSEETIIELSNNKMVTKTKENSCQTTSEYFRRDKIFR